MNACLTPTAPLPDGEPRDDSRLCPARPSGCVPTAQSLFSRPPLFDPLAAFALSSRQPALVHPPGPVPSWQGARRPLRAPMLGGLLRPGWARLPAEQTPLLDGSEAPLRMARTGPLCTSYASRPPQPVLCDSWSMVIVVHSCLRVRLQGIKRLCARG